MNIPGIVAKHAIVTPSCRRGNTDMGALSEAINRLCHEYVACLNVPDNADVNYHFVLTVERAAPDATKEKM